MPDGYLPDGRPWFRPGPGEPYTLTDEVMDIEACTCDWHKGVFLECDFHANEPVV